MADNDETTVVSPLPGDPKSPDDDQSNDVIDQIIDWGTDSADIQATIAGRRSVQGQPGDDITTVFPAEGGFNGSGGQAQRPGAEPGYIPPGLRGQGNNMRGQDSPYSTTVRIDKQQKRSRAPWAIALICVVALCAIALIVFLPKTQSGSAESNSASASASSQPAEASSDASASSDSQDAAKSSESSEVAESSGSAEEPKEDVIAVMDSVDEYSWEDLSKISDEISAASSESEAIDIAKSYHLCTNDGTLDGTQVKEVEFVNGVQAEVIVAGFWHDNKSDGSGKAGITFMFKDAETSHAMNETDTNSGGWESSDMRAWLDSSWKPMLPEDLRDAIVPVDKLTNNVGTADSADVVTVTSDELWLFSGRELNGYIDWYASDDMNPACDDVLNAEGEQYQLFRDTNVVSGSPNPILERVDWGDKKTFWWQRSAGPAGTTDFRSVLQKGDPGNQGSGASNEYGVIPGFCI